MVCTCGVRALGVCLACDGLVLCLSFSVVVRAWGQTPISQTEREAHGWSYEEWEALKTKDVMMRRVGTTREVANATLFFASEESSYCTGCDLNVDGGQMACTVMPELE